MSQSIEALIKTIKTLPDIKQRAISAIIGATVADAASRPLHWIYDQQKLNKIIGTNTKPEFWTTSESPFYTRDLGERSGYNDIMLTMLKSLHKTNGKFDMLNLCETINLDYGENTEYYEAYKQRNGWRRYIDEPIEGPWLQLAVVHFLQQYSTTKQTSLSNEPCGIPQGGIPQGALDNDQNDAFCLSIPLIVKNCDENNLWNSQVKDISSLMSKCPRSTKYYHLMTILLSTYVQNIKDPISHMKNEVQSLYPDIYESLIDVEKRTKKPFKDQAARLGLACYQPGTFYVSYLAMLHTDSYKDAIRLNITAGGDCCSRANIIGSCYAAKYGIDSIPIDWLRKTKDIENVIEMSIQVVTA